MDGEWDLMASSGAESVRTAFYWPSAQRHGSAPPDLAHLDGVVLQAARRGLPVLPIVTGTPGWAASRAHDETSPPRDPQLYADFLRTLVARYGPQGSLWAEHPEVARAADPRLADLERAEPDPLLVAAARPGLRAQLREAPQGGGPRAEGRRPRLAHDPRRPAERELDRAPEDLPPRRPRVLRRRGAAPVHGQAAQRRAPRGAGAEGDAPLQGRPQADLDHGAVVAGREGQDEEHDRLRDHRPRSGPASRRGPAAAGEGPQAPADPAGLLVHVALARELAELVRLLRPAPPARRAGSSRSPPSRRSARRRAGCRAARRRPATPRAAASWPSRRGRRT